MADTDNHQERLSREVEKLRREVARLQAEAAQNWAMEANITGLARLYRVLSKIHEAAIHLQEPKLLLQRACRIAVEDGLFKMAWVGLVQPDTLTVKPAVFWGFEEGYLEEIRLSLADIPEGQGPVGRAIREGKPCICEDMEQDPRQASWRLKALSRGFRGMGAFPLTVGPETIGAIAFYSQEPDFFDPDNIQLLNSIAAILSFALESGEREKKRRQAEKALEESEANYRELVESGNSIILRLDPHGNITFINTFAQQFFGYSKDEILGKNVIGTIVPEIESSGRDLAAMIDDLGVHPESYAINENENQRRNGERVWVAWTNKGVFDAQGILTEVLCIGNDITANRLANLLRANDQAVQAMALAIEMRDPYTAGHQQRVTVLACALAREMGLAEDRIQGLRLAGLLHDLGKIVVPAEFLSKPGKLRDHEWEVIKDHPYFGFEIMKGIDFPWPVAEMIYQHHEKWNGSGYPRGLAGEKILLEARILGVADVVEAMATHRPYRPAFGIDDVLEEISQHQGVFYDPQVTAALFSYHRRHNVLELFVQHKIERPGEGIPPGGQRNQIG
jgi:PAS domain S-box-containing protein/putative nucleotidyltransferase with HDIG domain